MPTAPSSQREKLLGLFDSASLLRAHELRTAGISPETIARAVNDGELERISRGLYQRHDADLDENRSLAEAAKRAPKGVVAMVSALAFHGLTDQMPRRVWMAIGSSDWSPAPSYPPLRIVRFRDQYLRQEVEQHSIAGVSVPIYSVAKTLADVFRNARLVDRSVAIEGLRAALSLHKATPGRIADVAKEAGAWTIMQPYLEALTSNG